MGAPLGNKYGRGKKGVSGRKPRAVELAVYINKIKEEITQEALIALSNKIIAKRLIEIDENGSVLLSKEFALPIALKAIKEKKEVDTTIKLSDDELKSRLAEKLADILE